MKTIRDYLNKSRFEDVWASIVEIFSEPEGIKPMYAEYFEKLKALTWKSVKGVIELSGNPTQYPDGMNGAPDRLIDKRVKTMEKDSAVVVATLLYWASLQTFYGAQNEAFDVEVGRSWWKVLSLRELGCRGVERSKKRNVYIALISV